MHRATVECNSLQRKLTALTKRLGGLTSVVINAANSSDMEHGYSVRPIVSIATANAKHERNKKTKRIKILRL